jgi:DNA-binding NarL/FixJ family response regulator
VANQNNRLRVLIADDHEVVRRGVRAIVEAEGIEVIGEAADGSQAVEMALQLKPNVVILDFSLPLLNGLEVARRIKAAAPTIELVMFTMHDNETIVREVLQAGARCYVLKTDHDTHLAKAVRSAAQRRPFFSWRVSETLLEEFLDPRDDRHSGPPLTSREREVVQLIAEGMSNKQISRHLTLSVKTVETHRAAAMRKIGVSSTASLVRYAVRNYIVVP